MKTAIILIILFVSSFCLAQDSTHYKFFIQMKTFYVNQLDATTNGLTRSEIYRLIIEYDMLIRQEELYMYQQSLKK